MFEIADNNAKISQGAKIKVIGVGGGGCNAVNTMIRSGLSGVEYIVANTDAQALNANLAPTKIQLGPNITKGLGAGANPEVGRKAALEDYEKLSEILGGADMVFITAGMGGGTGTGAAPVIAKLCKELGALTVGVVTKPFTFEGKKRNRQASEGIRVLEESVDSLITIPNQRLLNIAGDNLSLVDTFKQADEVLLNAVRGISDLINNTGHINADFADVATVMASKGLALMGTGACRGENRAVKAATMAISSPLLEDISIEGATGIIINITGGSNLTMRETNEAVTLIMEAADENAEIIFGTVIDESLSDEVKVTVIATGLAREAEEFEMSAPIQTRTRVQEQVAPQRVAPVQEEVIPQIAKAEPKMEPRFEPRAEVEAEVPKMMNPEEGRASFLVQSIKDAAKRYESAKSVVAEQVVHIEEERIITPSIPTAAKDAGSNNHREQQPSRARTIAEKLGFINFDEDEFDTPTFLRKEAKTNEESLFN